MVLRLVVVTTCTVGATPVEMLVMVVAGVDSVTVEILRVDVPDGGTTLRLLVIVDAALSILV